jgi:predicted acyl esterase
VLHFNTSAQDTDFYAALVDIDEKGGIRAIGTTGKIRASYLGGFDRQHPLIPGRDYAVHITPWDTAHELKAGHRLGLTIACDGFPLFARNLGTADPIKSATRMVVQKNNILHDSAHPSHLTFRVLWD